MESTLPKLTVLQNIYSSNEISLNKKARIPESVKFRYDRLDRVNKFHACSDSPPRQVSESFSVTARNYNVPIVTSPVMTSFNELGPKPAIKN
jgi:hypothetical protein